MIDVILSRIGKDDDGLGPNWSATERIVHKFHMYDVWSRVLIMYKETVLKHRPQVNIDFTLTIDNLRNGLETQAKLYATSVIHFTLEPCNFTLNTFQDFVFTYFKQEQKCECNYRLLKLFREINEAENHHLMFP